MVHVCSSCLYGKLYPITPGMRLDGSIWFTTTIPRIHTGFTHGVGPTDVDRNDVCGCAIPALACEFAVWGACGIGWELRAWARGLHSSSRISWGVWEDVVDVGRRGSAVWVFSWLVFVSACLCCPDSFLGGLDWLMEIAVQCLARKREGEKFIRSSKMKNWNPTREGVRRIHPLAWMR